VSAPVITNVGLVTPLAQGRAGFVDAWRAGTIATSDGEGALAGSLGAGRLKLRPWFPEQRNTLRRMDRLSKLMCLAAALARDDGGFGDGDALALGVGTDLGTLETTWSFLSRLQEKGPALANPMDFPNLVPNAGAGYVGIFCGLRGPSHTFCQHETAGDDAVAWGADLVRSGLAPGALVGGAEELSEVRLKAMGRVGCDTDRTAEGAALFLVETPDRAADRGAVPIASHLGSLGACGRVGPEPGRKGVDAAATQGLVERLLAHTGVLGRDVGAILGSDPALLAPARAALGHAAPATDHVHRLGQHPADGALRIALAALLVADRSLAVHAGADGIQGDAALVLSAARGGGLRATLIGSLP
jgi:3-oxoacyl-[acyl-carrier-protein] synthase II